MAASKAKTAAKKAAAKKTENEKKKTTVVKEPAEKPVVSASAEAGKAEDNTAAGKGSRKASAPAKKPAAEKKAAGKAAVEPDTAAEKKAAVAAVKEEKKAEVKVEAKKEEVKAEPKKVEVKAEPKKAPAKKAPVKKAEPKKEEAKVEVKAEPAKAEVKAEPKKVEVKVEAKKEEVKAEPKKVEVKAEPKKAPAKKAPVKKAEPKKEEVKAEVKAEPKKEEVKAEPKKVEVKAEPKKAPAKKAPVKKEEPKKPEISEAEKMAQYANFELNTCIDMARAMGIDMNQGDYEALLMKIAEPKEIVEEILKKYPVDEKEVSFEENGYDLTILPFLVEKIGEGMDVKAGDFKSLADDIKAAMELQLNDDALHNTDVYNTLFDLVRRVLMLAQQRDIHNVKTLDEIVGADVKALVNKFMDVAYEVLKTWQYNDVKYYEGFIFGVLSQLDDLHQEMGNRAMMDTADLLIIHGDYGLGDANYNYILRENQLKDQIYFRFANIYKDIDRNKAKSIAHQALNVVDGRYDWYPRIVEILES